MRYAVELIKKGLAYVDSLTADEIRALPRHADGTRKGQSLSDPLSRRESGSVCEDAGRRISGRRPCPARQNRYGVAEHQSARSRCSIASGMWRIIGPARPGASIRPTTMPIRCRMPSKASHTRSVRWNSKITAPSTIGSWNKCGARTIRSKSNSRRLNLTHTVMSKRKLFELVGKQTRHRLG